MTELVQFNNGSTAWKQINFSTINEASGTLKVIEYGSELDFEIKRVFYLCNIQNGAARGFHAHEELKQFLVCVAGSFNLILDNGITKKTYKMIPDSPGIWIDGKVWREMHDFTEGSVMMVLCDREYRFDNVVRDYELFKKNIGAL